MLVILTATALVANLRQSDFFVFKTRFNETLAIFFVDASFGTGIVLRLSYDQVLSMINFTRLIFCAIFGPRRFKRDAIICCFLFFFRRATFFIILEIEQFMLLAVSVLLVQRSEELLFLKIL